MILKFPKMKKGDVMFNTIRRYRCSEGEFEAFINEYPRELISHSWNDTTLYYDKAISQYVALHFYDLYCDGQNERWETASYNECQRRYRQAQYYKKYPI